MTEISLPYGKHSLEAEIPDANLIGIYQSRVENYQPVYTEEEIVYEALNNPIDSALLETLAVDKSHIVIITSDHTRPVPSRIIMPQILQRLRKGNPTAKITILVATGYHRPSSQKELIEKLGKEIVNKENIVMHFSQKSQDMTNLGKLPSGGDLLINSIALDADLLIAEGFIEPHFFAGFSGGRKSVLPGIASAQTVLANHCSEFIQSPFAKTGILDNNPIHKDMIFAANVAKLQFIVNVVINSEKQIIHAVAGSHEPAHRKGCEFLSDLCCITPSSADIVITSNGGSPLDQNIYQTVKGMTAAEASCKKNGIIIIVAACNDGHGGESFYQNMANASSPHEVLKKVANIPRNATLPDQWEFQILARILAEHKVFIVTDQCDPQIIYDMHMKHAYTINHALNQAFAIKGKNAKVAVIPDGVSVMVNRSN